MYELWNRLQYMLSPQFDIYETVSSVVSGHVADIGCGTGFGTNILTRHADTVYGFDIDAKAIGFANKCFGNHKIKFMAMSLDEICEAKRKFDWITMIDVIEHIHHDSGAIAQCRSLLKDSGKMVVSTPNRLSRYRKSENHVREYSPQELRTLLIKHFKDVDLVDFQMAPSESEYDNPILGVCFC